jgi:H+/Cl- antiporter ClcA
MVSSAADRSPAQPANITAEQAAKTMVSRPYILLLVVVAIVGVVVSLAAWCFLEGIYQLDRELYTHLPHALGYEQGPPLWWPLPVLGIAGLVIALAIKLLPGDGGHLPAKGLAVGGKPTTSIELPGVIVAGLVAVGSGIVLGPEAPLIAIGSGGALLLVSLGRRKTPPQALQIIAAAGSFAALSFIFGSPLIAAVILIEATGIGGARLRLILIPGLLAAGIGSLVSIGMGSFTGLSTSAYALGRLQLPHFGHPDIAEFGWTIALAAAIALGARVVMAGGLGTHRLVSRRLTLSLPAVGLVVAGLAIAFHGASGRSVDSVLFSGQSALPGLVAQAHTWSISALLLLIGFKGLAYSLSLGSFRGGPTFPGLFLGTAAGILASHLPGFSLDPAVAVGLGAATAAILGLPLSGAIIATFLCANAGTGDEPLVIVGVVVAYMVTLALRSNRNGSPGQAQEPADRTPGDPGAHTDPVRGG